MLIRLPNQKTVLDTGLRPLQHLHIRLHPLCLVNEVIINQVICNLCMRIYVLRLKSLFATYSLEPSCVESLPYIV
jgi:hypothetical protein